ncbi:uncharacterized protein LOC125674089 isoform X2 [Ostrea edulis]|uniref:uncharacterized protein LOC125674089 isoform X2 n=1 Tax=Ostrea edulis TaxID=37623 RepID=UPI0024AEAC3F|nr:uncharacterized protein LOC125674089 isoform X2 [Ostrea edulis]
MSDISLVENCTLILACVYCKHADNGSAGIECTADDHDDIHHLLGWGRKLIEYTKLESKVMESEITIFLYKSINYCDFLYQHPVTECIESKEKGREMKHNGERRMNILLPAMDGLFLLRILKCIKSYLQDHHQTQTSDSMPNHECDGRKGSRDSCCGKNGHHDPHTDNKNHQCNCRICMNSRLRFTDLSSQEMNLLIWYLMVLDHMSESAELRDILSQYCDLDILQVCARGMGGFDRPFFLQWVPQVPSCLVRFNDTVVNPLEQICKFSKLEPLKLSILDFFGQKDCLNVEIKRKLYRLSINLSCFLQITKDIVCYLSKESLMLSFCQTFHTLMGNSLLFTMINHAKPVPLPSKGPRDDVNEIKSGKTSLSSLENTVRKDTTRHLLKEFFLQQGDSTCLKYENVKDSSQEIENIGLKKNKQGEKDESFEKLLDEEFYEMFAHVEVRNPVEVLVYPATQQLVLEPLLNKFSMPESTPSKHDTMAVEFLRLCTMHDYPSTNGPSLLRLAQAGFYYEGNGIELVCFSCNFRKGSWNYHDSPREIHQRMSPNCKFLSQSGDGNVPIPREESTQDPPQSSPFVGEVQADGPRSATAGETPNNTAHLASANYGDGQEQSLPPRRPMVVKHPEYANRSTRLASYANFPRHMKQHPADMTDAGFYYAGFGDCCRCYHCGIGLRNWDPEDNPWIEHARWSSECPYILKVKGQAFIDLVQEAARAAEMAEDDDSEGEGDSVGSNKDASNEKTGASNSSSGELTGNSQACDEIENNVAKTSEATVSKGVSSGDSGFGSGSTVQAQPIKAPLRTAAAQSLIHEEKIKPKYVTAAIEDLVKAEEHLRRSASTPSIFPRVTMGSVY